MLKRAALSRYAAYRALIDAHADRNLANIDIKPPCKRRLRISIGHFQSPRDGVSEALTTFYHVRLSPLTATRGVGGWHGRNLTPVQTGFSHFGPQVSPVRYSRAPTSKPTQAIQLQSV